MGRGSCRTLATLLQQTVGRTPEIAALSLFVASALTEVSQIYWPRGMFSGRFDPLDIAAYAAGVGACYIAEKKFSNQPDAAQIRGR